MAIATGAQHPPSTASTNEGPRVARVLQGDVLDHASGHPGDRATRPGVPRARLSAWAGRPQRRWTRSPRTFGLSTAARARPRRPMSPRTPTGSRPPRPPSRSGPTAACSTSPSRGTATAWNRLSAAFAAASSAPSRGGVRAGRRPAGLQTRLNHAQRPLGLSGSEPSLGHGRFPRHRRRGGSDDRRQDDRVLPRARARGDRRTTASRSPTCCKERGHRIVFVVDESFTGVLEAKGFEERLMRMAPPEENADPDADPWAEFIRVTAPEFRSPRSSRSRR